MAVLAGGVDIPYPAGHSALLHRIRGSGLLVSEYPPGIRPARYRFLARNRLVAALSGATVVVEAGVRGAASTAAWAGHWVGWCVRYPDRSRRPPQSGVTGCCSPEAELVTRADEVRELVGRAGELADELPRPVDALDALTDNERRVYEALPARRKDPGRDRGHVLYPSIRRPRPARHAGHRRAGRTAGWEMATDPTQN